MPRLPSAPIDSPETPPTRETQPTQVAQSVFERLHVMISKLLRQNLEPEWIILGQEEWLEFRAMARREHIGDAWWLDPTQTPTFCGYRIATVPVAHHLSVTAKVPR